jgi:hypothetical protein
MDKNIDELNNMAVVAVWKKSERAKTFNMTVFNSASVDQVNTTRARNPIIPNDAPIIELGVGKGFVQLWMKKYKIKKYHLHP